MPGLTLDHLNQNLWSGSLCCCCCSVAKLCPALATPWSAAYQASLSLTITQSLPKFMSIESVMLSNHLILYHCLFCLPRLFNLG